MSIKSALFPGAAPGLAIARILSQAPAAPRRRREGSPSLGHFVDRYIAARERGASGLLEMIAVIAVILTLIVGGLVLYNQVTFSSRINDTARQLTSLQTEIRSVFQGQANFDGLDNEFLITAQAHPSDILVGDDLQHAFGGIMTVEAVTGEPSFTVELEAMPKAACVRLIQTTASGSGNSGQAGFNIEAISVNEEAAGTNGLVDATEAATACDGDTNDVLITYGR